MSDFYENLLKATEPDITIEKFGIITQINDNHCSVKEINSDLEHANVPILNKINLEVGDKVILGFIENDLYNPIVLGSLDKSISQNINKASQTEYGIVKLINDLESSSYEDGSALSAYQGAVLKDIIDRFNNLCDIYLDGYEIVFDFCHDGSGGGGGDTPTYDVDDYFSNVSTNPVQNKVIKKHYDDLTISVSGDIDYASGFLTINADLIKGD